MNSRSQLRTVLSLYPLLGLLLLASTRANATDVAVYGVQKGQLYVIGEAGRMYRIDATTDFVTWSQLINTNAPSGGNFSFTDGQASSMSRRFYRVVLP